MTRPINERVGRYRQWRDAANSDVQWLIDQPDLTGGGGGAAGVNVQDEGVAILTPATTLNFIGAGVTAADAGSGVASVTIPGGVNVEDEGSTVVSAAAIMNFVGAGVTATNAGGGEATITIPGGGVDIEDEGSAVVSGASVIDFVGAGVTATSPGAGQATVTIPGGVNTEDEGSAVNTPANTINFVGSGVVATDAGGGQTDVTVDAGPGINPPLQKFFGRRRPRWITSTAAAQMNMVNWGVGGLTNLGAPSATPINPAPGYVSQWSTQRLNAGATANAWYGFASPKLFWLGDDTNQGGLYYSAEFTILTQNTTFRWFDGFWNANGTSMVAIGSSVEPSALIDVVGFGMDSTDSNLQVIHNDATGGATKIDLGSSFVMQGTTNIAYFCSLFWLPNATAIDYYCEARDNNGTLLSTQSGTASSNLPTNTVFMGWTRQLSPVNASASLGWGAGNTYFETPGY